ncbi:WS/DGAT domain-containing protein [Rhodococcoides trifolii]|nr:WS/DGAT domain-containing protein [Rhodococcus trifolii]
MNASDAQMLWMSAKIPSDQFLLFCFDGAVGAAADVRATVVARAHTIDTLQLKCREVPFSLDYPIWVPMAVTPAHVVDHRLPSARWVDCRSAIEKLITTAVDVHDTPWLVHIFGPVSDAPRCGESALVIVLQISHALVDGRGASDVARALFGTDDREQQSPPRRSRTWHWQARFPVVPAVAGFPGRLVSLVRRGRTAQRASVRLDRDTNAGLVPGPTHGRTRLPINSPPGERRSVRPIVCEASNLRRDGVTVTAGALTAVSSALARYLEHHGHDVPGDLSAETTLGKDTAMSANNFRNGCVDLHPRVTDLVERARAITESMGERRRRFAHPAFAAADRATELVPAPLMKWGIRQFDANAVPERVTGHTVLSSVNRGRADLMAGGGTVAWTAGFPALSPVMGLTHGVHGIGDTVTLTIVTSPAVMPDVDFYEHLLRAAVSDVERAFRAT